MAELIPIQPIMECSHDVVVMNVNLMTDDLEYFCIICETVALAVAGH